MERFDFGGSDSDLRGKIEDAIRSFDAQVEKLDDVAKRLTKKHNSYYEKVLDGLKKENRGRATVYANEVAELRKVIHGVNHSKLAMEQIAVRLDTVKDIGDIVASLAPATRILRSAQDNISEVLPQAEDEFSQLSEMVSVLLVELGGMKGQTLDFSVANEEAERIMDSAEMLVEKEMEESLPEVPETPDVQVEEDKGEELLA